MVNQSLLLEEILNQYVRHGWRLKGVLMTAHTRAEIQNQHRAATFEGVPVKESSFDALWFSRPSHSGRVAWELRLVAETPYALLETFEQDETEEYCQDIMDDMEARLCFFHTTGNVT